MKYLTLNNSGEKKIQSIGSQLDYKRGANFMFYLTFSACNKSGQ